MAGTLQELIIALSKTQQTLVQAITDNSPFFRAMRFEPSTHGFWHAFEEVSSISGGGWIEMNEAVPESDIKSGLKRVSLAMLAGKVVGKEDTVMNFPGGRAEYFRKKAIPIIEDAAQKAEYKLIYDYFRAKALSAGNQINAGGSGSEVYSIVAIRFKQGECGGLYNQNMVQAGNFFTMTPLYGGNVYEEIDLVNSTKINAYAMYFKAPMGVIVPEEANKHTAVIANITPSKLPSASHIKEALRMVRADRNTVMVMHPYVADAISEELFTGKIQVQNGQTGLIDTLDTYNGVPIIRSWNMLDNEDEVVFS